MVCLPALGGEGWRRHPPCPGQPDRLRIPARRLTSPGLCRTPPPPFPSHGGGPSRHRRHRLDSPALRLLIPLNLPRVPPATEKKSRGAAGRRCCAVNLCRAVHVSHKDEYNKIFKRTVLRETEDYSGGFSNASLQNVPSIRTPPPPIHSRMKIESFRFSIAWPEAVG